MRAVPLPKARMNTRRVALLFRRTVIGLMLVVGVLLGALRLLESHVVEAPRSFTAANPSALDPTGMWRGNWGRFPATLHLIGALESLEGNLRIEFPGGHRAQIGTTGSYNSDQGVLTLEEDPTNQVSSGVYELYVSEDGLGLTGEILTAKGEALEFRMVRQ